MIRGSFIMVNISDLAVWSLDGLLAERTCGYVEDLMSGSRNISIRVEVMAIIRHRMNR